MPLSQLPGISWPSLACKHHPGHRLHFQRFPSVWVQMSLLYQDASPTGLAHLLQHQQS